MQFTLGHLHITESLSALEIQIYLYWIMYIHYIIFLYFWPICFFCLYPSSHTWYITYFIDKRIGHNFYNIDRPLLYLRHNSGITKYNYITLFVYHYNPGFWCDSIYLKTVLQILYKNTRLVLFFFFFWKIKSTALEMTAFPQ